VRTGSAITQRLRSATLALGCWLAGAPALAQGQGDIPAPERIDPQTVQAWFERYIQAEGWTLIAADNVAVALASPASIAATSDGRIIATVRHEYYAQRELGGAPMRSLQQIRMIDCQRRANRVIAMTVFEKSNLQGASVRREMPGAEWSTPEPGSLYQAAIDRICAAAAAQP
jgi:hypothetical protein